MANEATLYIQTGLPIDMTVANGTAIAKGAVLKIADLMTASSADGTDDMIAGIAAAEKIADDGVTKLAVFREGIFKMYLSGTAALGDPVGSIATWTNYIASNKSTVSLSGSVILGTAFEDATNGHTILVELKPQINAYSFD